ncbi:MAG TPA: aminotransferase class I/II-fold pyridoxal phosphate-dependent enzyme [Terriglobales bacterium]
MDFQNFELETFQSKFERTVDYNLADSSVQCAAVNDLLAGQDAEPLLNLPLYYPEVNGTALLRERIAALYSDSSAGNVLVTVGASQANSLICSTLLEPGDEVVVVSPGYRQVWGLARNLGCVVRELELRPEDNWRLDLDELEKLAGPKTRMISVVNPNNPTGTILREDEIERVVAISEKTGAWLHADEVYCDTEQQGGPTPSFWGRYDKVIVANSLSKAYGLAGLRIGWVLAGAATVEALWRRHEYALIAAAGPSMKLAEIALAPTKRAVLVERQKRLTRVGQQTLNRWVGEQGGRFSWTPPPATSIAFVRSHLHLSSVELADSLRTRVSVLVAPGAYLGAENHFRIALGYQPEKLELALERIAEAVATLDPVAAS